MAIQYIDSLPDLSRKRVLARFDFNVPLTEEGDISDSSRIDRALETISYLLEEKKAKKLVLMSHLGRPKGEADPKFSLEPVAKYLAQKLNQDVFLTEKTVDNGLKELLELPKTKIVLLENLRFDSREKKNDPDFARELGEFGDIYINDAFGVSHRKHASVHAIIQNFPRQSYGGFLIKKELEALNKIVNKPRKPFVGIIGGAKVSDKITTIEKLLIPVDHLLIGGAMAYPFLKAQGKEIGRSLCFEEDVKLANKILKMDKGNKIILPIDHICSRSVDGAPSSFQQIPGDQMGLDIGDKTLESFKKILGEAQTIFWNGPMGLFEKEAYSRGTMKLAEIISQTKAYSLVGGGDSVNAIKKSGLFDQFSHISTGGGASLEYIEKGNLPGIRALQFGVHE